ncbi:expansin EXLX1 family cellulose-binding protein [Kitasatospora sp. NPDC005751]|uniref:expansin EXLX1 family cellulose-binding protein n=1 Tax=unclassified Kitasatospora TaxID=2633591 RepID=UPI0033E0C070
MRATKHAAPQSRRGLVMGVPLVLVAAGVLAFLAFALLPGSGGGGGSGEAAAGRPAAASVAATAPSTGQATGPAVGTAAETAAPTASAAPPGTTPTVATASAAGTPSPATAAPSPPATTTPRPSTAGATPSPSATAHPVPATASLAGRIKPGASYPGVATSYDAADGNGACSFGPSGDLMVAAMNHTDYESAKACGASVLVRAANGATLTVRIVNECPLPCAPGQLDLSHQAFAELAELSVGRLPITWTLLSPGAPETMSVRYKTGSTQWWCGIQAIGHRNPVATLEVRAPGGWRQLPRSDYNYFLSADGTGCGGPIRVTDIYGEQLTVDGIALQAGIAQPARVQFARH